MERKLWLDYVRAFACILVSLGHMLMGLEDAGLIRDSALSDFFIRTIYHFHVFVFLFCSGFLFQQKQRKYADSRSMLCRKAVRCIDLLIPYVLFSSATYFIKVLFSSNVNSPSDYTLAQILFEHPTNQMWFLYALILIELVLVPVCSNRLLYILCGTAVSAKALFFLFEASAPAPAKYFLSNLIWFVLGMAWAYKKVRFSKPLSFAFVLAFLCGSLLEFFLQPDHALADTLLTFIGIIGCVEGIRSLTEQKQTMHPVWALLSKYMFQIYLLHTIFAAGIRIVLVKLGCTNLPIHILLGLIFSFVVPILCAAIAERVQPFNFVFFPSKTVKALFRRQEPHSPGR